MPEPAAGKPKAKGPQLKPFAKVKVTVVPEAAKSVEAAVDIKPSAVPIQKEKPEEDETGTIVEGFFKRAKPKAAEKESKPVGAPPPKAVSAAPVPKPLPAPKVTVVEPVKKPEVPALGVPGRKPRLLPPESKGEEPDVEEAPVAKPKKITFAKGLNELLSGEPAPVVPARVEPTDEDGKEEEPPAPAPKSSGKAKRIKISSALLSKLKEPSGEKPTLDGYPLTEEEAEALSEFSSSDLSELAKAILKIEKENPYKTGVPEDGYVPENRRAFTDFITNTFSEFKLALPPTKPNYDACKDLMGAQQATIYQYQEFVRDYMRWQSPYRGLLIYHGLGSGKTCSAIAAAEALFSQSNRRIIVLTPASLQQNFLKEISFCGFQHFRLNNNWIGIPKNPEREPLIMMFAEKVLKIPRQYLNRPEVTTIWIPDFRKEGEKGTMRSRPFKDLKAGQQQEIRDQIENIVFRVDSKDPKKARYGRIQFISYNGISKETLRSIASSVETEGGFDNAIIIIDEIHNLIRNMLRQIEPFLIDLKTRRKKITFDPITYERWMPKKSVTYPRGILFYRLLISARNSKIIGLSGTPIINFPEEIGVLSNVLHGYNFIGKMVLPSKAGSMSEKDQLEAAAREFRYCDFYEAYIDPSKGIVFTVTMLQEGVRKIEGKQGVERIPMGEDTVSIPDRFRQFEAFLRTKKLIREGQEFTIQAEPLLPPTRETFMEYFGSTDNDFILMKRMSGLISYYKGSRKDLMPEKSEEIVLCPMSAYAQEYYLKLRAEEVDIEEKAKKRKKKSKGVGDLSKFWAMAYDIENLDVANSWRVATRQACNFAFPEEVRRPRPSKKMELAVETGLDRDLYLDDIGAQKREDEGDEFENENSASQLSNLQQEENNAAGVADEEFNQAIDDRIAELREQLEKGEITQEAFDEELEELEESRRDTADFVPENTSEANVAEMEAKVAALQKEIVKRCKAVKLFPEEDYAQRIARAMTCLREFARDKLEYQKTLSNLSSKYEKIIENVLRTPGSNLVYSNYLSMEGLGIFTMILDMLGWEKIVIQRSGKTLKFSDETIASLEKGPDVNRYIYFTGSEDDIVRKSAINVFNVNMKDLPSELSSVLEKAGYADNKTGQLCRMFCITSAGAEGLSLRNVRAVHIMEPHWNDVRMSQVKGRAIRICSHSTLDPSERNVKVYIYLSVFDDRALGVGDTKGEGKKWQIPFEIAETDSVPASQLIEFGVPINPEIGNYIMTTDMVLFSIALRKRQMSERIQRLMKMSAVDCELNINENQDGTFQCVKFGEGGDFLYHPNLKEDIERWNKKEFKRVDLTAKSVETEEYKAVRIKDQEYIVKPSYEDGTIKEYVLYPLSDFDFKHPFATVNVSEDGKPLLEKGHIHKIKKSDE